MVSFNWRQSNFYTEAVEVQMNIFKMSYKTSRYDSP